MAFPAWDDADSPQVFGYSIEKNLKGKVAWFLHGVDVRKSGKGDSCFSSGSVPRCSQEPDGMKQNQIAKVIAAFPSVLGSSMEQNLKQKVEWLLQLGVTQDQVVTIKVCTSRYITKTL